MAIPLFEFRLKLGRGYYVRCFAWQGRREMERAAGDPYPGEPLDAVTVSEGNGRRVADVHFCRSALNNGVLVHELYHVICDYRRRVKRRFASDFDAEEDAAKVIQRAFNAASSHIREELRLASR